MLNKIKKGSGNFADLIDSTEELKVNLGELPESLKNLYNQLENAKHDKSLSEDLLNQIKNDETGTFKSIFDQKEIEKQLIGAENIIRDRISKIVQEVRNLTDLSLNLDINTTNLENVYNFEDSFSVI